MGMQFYLRNPEGIEPMFPEIEEYGLSLTYGNAERMLHAIGWERNIVDADYYVEFDPTFLAEACKRAIAEQISRNIEPMMLQRILILRKIAEYGMAIGANAVVGA